MCEGSADMNIDPKSKVTRLELEQEFVNCQGLKTETKRRRPQEKHDRTGARWAAWTGVRDGRSVREMIRLAQETGIMKRTKMKLL